MPIYAVTFLAAASHTVQVEAEGKEEAIDKAFEEGTFPRTSWDGPDIGDWEFGGEWPNEEYDDYVEEIS